MFGFLLHIVHKDTKLTFNINVLKNISSKVRKIIILKVCKAYASCFSLWPSCGFLFILTTTGTKYFTKDTKLSKTSNPKPKTQSAKRPKHSALCFQPPPCHLLSALYVKCLSLYCLISFHYKFSILACRSQQW